MKHLIIHSYKVSDYRVPMYELSGWQYWSKRIKFWIWRKQRTTGRSVLVLRSRR